MVQAAPAVAEHIGGIFEGEKRGLVGEGGGVLRADCFNRIGGERERVAEVISEFGHDEADVIFADLSTVIEEKNVDAVKQLVADGVPADKVSEKAIRARLYDPDMPDPELMVRTSGESRISNYLLWQLAYSELVFTDVLWPDFRKEHLVDAIREYQARERRFGAVSSS